MNLPTQKRNAISINPKFLVYFGKPKVGKTTLAAGLENNLIIDLEKGTHHLDALVLEANSVKELSEIAKAISDKNKEINGYFYKYITIDNGTKLEEIVESLALSLYQNTPMGKSYNESVKKLPNGGGYLYLREAFFKVIDMYKSLCETLILICHCSDKLINKEGKELSEMSIDLTGKTARLIAADADAIGYVYRQKNQTFMNFNGGGDFIVEARQNHLRGKEIIVAESDENNKVVTYWDSIFIKDKQ